MSRAEKKLTALGVKALTTAGRYADGGGLYLEVKEARRGEESVIRRSWIWRYRHGDRRRDMGLGAAADVTLADARAERDRWRETLKLGRDPIDERERQRASAVRSAPGIPTFGEAADAFIAAKEPGWRNAKGVYIWKMTLREYAKDIRSLPVDKITTADVLSVLKPIWNEKPVTAARLRGRIEMVIDSARAHGHIDEGRANPARWRGHLDKLLSNRPSLARVHYEAMSYKDVPAFIERLQAIDTVGARGLEFAILTAARGNEVIGATWSEINFDEKVWVIPKERMKAGREHRVPLTGRAVAILEEMKALSREPFVFPGRMPKRPLNHSIFLQAISRAKADCTAHGFRSSFRDWAGEATGYPREIAEAALAHAVGDMTERAYRRGDALERRRAMMDAWAAFLEAPPAGNVVKLEARRKDG